MIAFIRGKLEYADQESVIIDVQGVGYRIFVPAAVLQGLPAIGSELKLYTYQYVKEDVLALYGFTSLADKEVFLKLLSIAGIGPKLALTIVSCIPGGDLGRIVMHEDEAALTRIPGIGKKTAKRILLELKDKMAINSTQLGTRLPGDAPQDLTAVAAAFDALLALGYNPPEIRQVLQKIPATQAAGAQDTGDNVQWIIKEALKLLAKI